MRIGVTNLTFPLYTGWGSVVKSPTPQKQGFRLPNVVARQKSDSYRKVFLCLYSISDQSSTFELDAVQISQATGISRKTVYKVIGFLQRVNLLKPVIVKTGRGRHSLYRLNWRKPSKQQVQMKQNKQASQNQLLKHQKKCHPPKMLKTKDIHPSGDGAIAQTITPQNPILWKRCLKSFRELLAHSQLSKGQQRLCIGVLGRHLKGKSREYGMKLFDKLKAMVGKLQVPEWVKYVQDLCRWFMGVIRWLLGEGYQSQRAEQQREAQKRQEEQRFLEEMERSQADHACWLEELRGKSLAEKLAYLWESLEVWALAFEGLYGRRPDDAEKQLRWEELSRELAIAPAVVPLP